LRTALMQHDLIDEYRAADLPGGGAREGAAAVRGRHEARRAAPGRHRTTSAGVTMNVYRPADEPTYGSFEASDSLTTTGRSSA